MLHNQEQQRNSLEPFSIVAHHHPNHNHNHHKHTSEVSGTKGLGYISKSWMKWVVVIFLTISISVVVVLSSSSAAIVPLRTRWLNCPVCPQTTSEAIASQNRHEMYQHPDHPSTTNISHIVFGIGGSVATWSNRRRYTQLWWKPNRTRGFVWLEEHPKPPEHPDQANHPPYRVSEYRGGGAAANRISRIVLESYRVGLERVRWFVMGDDDTVFFPHNLVTVLSRYDHNEMYYIGGNSESVEQNVMHSYGMAFGGGGFAISYALAAQLDKVLDACIRRYSYFYGSDERIEACLAEIGVPLTPNRGFHQNDVRGNLYGLLAAHPLTPLISLHHLEAVTPIFPSNTQLDSLKLLFSAYNVDPGRILQQSFCHDLERNWSISVSWGYTVQLYPSLLTAKVLQTALLTFKTWRSWSNAPFTFNTRQISSDPCEHPLVYFLDHVSESDNDEYMTSYKRFVGETGLDCERAVLAVHRVNVRTTKMMPNDWKVPRRQCCEVLNRVDGAESVINMRIRKCKPSESVSMPS